MPRAATLADLAKRLGLSRTTVSEALRGRERVNRNTREEVCRVAREIGYKRNVLVGEMMADLRRTGAGGFKGSLAVLDLDGPARRSSGGNRYHDEVRRGAEARAEELDFKAELIVAEAERLSFGRLREILRARGVRGVLLLPMSNRPDLEAFDWAGLSGLYADYLIDRPGLHAICPDHYRGMMLALERVRAFGYRRPGLVLHGVHDARVLHRWEAAHHAFHMHNTGLERLAPFIMPARRRAEDFKAWFAESGCDVVLTHQADVREWMEEAGARVPETHGFCCLNLINSTRPCAGLDLSPGLLGARGVELLIGQVLRGETGVSERPLTMTMPVDWVDGPTLMNVDRSPPVARPRRPGRSRRGRAS